MKVFPHVPTGSKALDKLLGKECPGFPRGRMSEVTGPSGSGKTTLLLAAAAEVTKLEGMTFYFDSMAQIHSELPGVQRASEGSRLGVFNPKSVDDLIRPILAAIAEGVDLVVVDTLSELSGPQRQEGFATFSREIGGLVKRLQVALEGANTAIVFANTSRPRLSSGEPLEAPGGIGFKFAMYLRVQLTHEPADEVTTEEPVIRAEIIKNAMTPNLHRSVKFKLRDGLVKSTSTKKAQPKVKTTRFDREDPI